MKREEYFMKIKRKYSFQSASMFFEPSTRTKLSFESAINKLGGKSIGFSDITNTSQAKGESFYDTIKTVEQYADILIIRHPKEGAARYASDICKKPVINAGDGSNQHPSQALIDLFTIKHLCGHIDNIKIALVGDLKFSRTIHSLFQALLKFQNVHILLISPDSLTLPKHFHLNDDNNNKNIHSNSSIKEVFKENCDILYMTRIQKERFPDLLEYEKVKNSYCINMQMLKDANPNLKILHPLPRINEISQEVDSTKYAKYFKQVEFGIIMRQAILIELLQTSEVNKKSLISINDLSLDDIINYLNFAARLVKISEDKKNKISLTKC